MRFNKARRLTFFRTEKQVGSSHRQDAVNFARHGQSAQRGMKGSKMQIGGSQCLENLIRWLRRQEAEVGNLSTLHISFEFG
jgi:hypothetical protein